MARVIQKEDDYAKVFNVEINWMRDQSFVHIMSNVNKTDAHCCTTDNHHKKHKKSHNF